MQNRAVGKHRYIAMICVFRHTPFILYMDMEIGRAE
jgi:hypothetical protein